MPAASLPERVDITPLRAPRGPQRRCRGWAQEAALRMLLNSCDADVAEYPDELITHNHFRPVPDRDVLQVLCAQLETLEDGQCLRIENGRPVAMATRPVPSPGIEISADSNFADAVTAGWVYVGAQAWLPAAWAMLAGLARERFSGSLAGRLVASVGLDPRRAPLPLAVTLNGGTYLGIERDPECIKRRLRSGYCDIVVNHLDEALRVLRGAVRKREPASVGLVGDAAQVLPELVRRGVVPDVFVDTVPMLSESAAGAVDALARIGSWRVDQNWDSDSTRGALMWVALSGAGADIHAADAVVRSVYSDDAEVTAWLDLARRQLRFQGLPARTAWLRPERLGQLAVALNTLAGSGTLQAPLLLVATDSSPATASADVDAAADWTACVTPASPAPPPHVPTRSVAFVRALVLDGRPETRLRAEAFAAAASESTF